MSIIVEVEKLALDLTEKDRATLAAKLLNSLPGILADEDEGTAEALRRDAEVEAIPRRLSLLRTWISGFRVGAADASRVPPGSGFVLARLQNLANITPTITPPQKLTDGLMESVSGGTRWSGGLWINTRDEARFWLSVPAQG